MNKKSVAASTLVVFLAIFFSIIGICFSMFVFADTKIEVKSVKLVLANGIEVFSDKELTKSATELKLSKMELGLKPATGELDAETKIPSTINDQGTSEGYYSTVFVKTNSDFKVYIEDVKIDSKKYADKVDAERENVFVAIKDVEGAVKNIKEDKTELASFSNVEGSKELVFYIWLDALAGKELEGAIISFSLNFVSV